MGKLNKYWLTLFLIFSIIGIFSSSIVLYIYYYLHIAPPLCTNISSPFPGVTIDCIKVLSSKYAELFDEPLDFLAIIWFIINIILVLIYNYSRNYDKIIFRFLMYWRFIGLLIIPYLIYIEFFILKAVCLYCTIMHIMIIADFIVVTYYSYKNKLGILLPKI
ncbi:MAG: vitamin K epoxide reductase family protein [Nanopusillaceae archaeon]|jgi:uncharacterized membrane protein